MKLVFIDTFFFYVVVSATVGKSQRSVFIGIQNGTHKKLYLYKSCRYIRNRFLLGPPEPNIHAGFQSFQSSNTQNNHSRYLFVFACGFSKPRIRIFVKNSPHDLSSAEQPSPAAAVVFSRLWACRTTASETKFFRRTAINKKTVPASSA